MASPYSPHVLECVSVASKLTTQLRHIMSKIQICNDKQLPVPVKLSRKANQLVEQVKSWDPSIVDDKIECPMRYQQNHEETTSPTKSTSSTTSQIMDSHNTLSPPKLHKKQSYVSIGSVLRNKYKKSLKKTKANQKQLISSFK